MTLLIESHEFPALQSCVCSVLGAYYVPKPSANDQRNAFLCSITQLLSVNAASDQELILDLLTGWGLCGLRFAALVRRESCDQLHQQPLRED